MSVVVLVGAQWGDEGKGSVADVYASGVDLVVHYAGGANPGQTVVAEGERMVFHVIPSGTLRHGTPCLLAQGMAIDPTLLLEELEALSSHGAQNAELKICRRAHVVLPHHLMVDALRGEGEGASGAPRRGIGPAYGDKVARRGVQLGDLLVPERFTRKLHASLEASEPVIRALGGEPPEAAPIVDRYLACGEKLRPMMVEGSRYVAEARAAGKHVLLEGPFGAMVDVDQGVYPYVVGTSTMAGGACTGVGIAPRDIDQVVGVAKAYSTRPGQGPFPSEVTGALATRLQKAGGEIDPISGRPRRCGMFDVPALRLASRVSGFDVVALTKLDVLTGIDELPLCVAYELDGEELSEPPYEGQSRIKPRLEMMAGWTEDLRDCRSWDDLPDNARRYVERIEELSGLRVGLIGVGPDRSESIVRETPFS